MADALWRVLCDNVDQFTAIEIPDGKGEVGAIVYHPDLADMLESRSECYTVHVEDPDYKKLRERVKTAEADLRNLRQVAKAMGEQLAKLFGGHQIPKELWEAVEGITDCGFVVQAGYEPEDGGTWPGL